MTMALPDTTNDGAAPPEDVLFGKPAETTPEQQTDTNQPAEPPKKEAKAQPRPSDDASEASPAKALEGDDESESPTAGDYEDFSAPDGVAPLSSAEIAGLSSVAKELNLSQDQAQKLVTSLTTARQEAQQQAVAATFDGWVRDLHADEEVGGEKFKPSMGAVRAALKFATPEFRQMLTGPNTQLLNHPEVFRFMARIGKAISSDNRFVAGKPVSEQPKVNMQNPLSSPDEVANLFYGPSSK